MLNPLFPNDNNEDSDEKKTGVDPFQHVKRHDKKIEPIHREIKSEPNPAADLIRQKVAALYAKEPNAKEEIAEVKQEPKPLSKHQKFMQELSTSGKSLAEIQTAWHNYYLNLPNDEKHAVWQEFYENNAKNSRYNAAAEQPRPEVSAQTHTPHPAQQAPLEREASAVNPNESQVFVADHTPETHRPSTDKRTVSDIKRQIAGRVNANGKLTVKHHLQSLLFGLGIGLIVVVFTLFSFFNEYIIAPFIQPSRHVSATPIIVGTDGVAASSTPEVIIPKINVEIPLVGFDLNTTSENQIEDSLEDGVVHYPTTVQPGQKGNTAFFGHSSNNIFNPGKYKFAFVLLHELVPGDTFYLTYQGKVYAYQVYDKQVVDPSNVAVLDNVPGKVATATLITCDPPGTSLHRLVVWGEQVSPSPATNATGSNTSSTATGVQLPDNGPSLWSRMVSTVKGWF